MGAGASTVDADIQTLKTDINKLKGKSYDGDISKLNANYSKLKDQIDSSSKAVAAQVDVTTLAKTIINDSTLNPVLAQSIVKNFDTSTLKSLALPIASEIKTADIAKEIVNNNLTDISNKIITDTATFYPNLTKSFKEAEWINLSTQVIKNDNLPKSIAGQIMGDATLVSKLPRGPPGDLVAGGYTPVQQNIGARTMWCADGDICTIPAKYIKDMQYRGDIKNLTDATKTADVQGIAIARNQKILLAGPTDPNHGIAHKDAVGFGGNDGPVVFGWSGGNLGSANKNIALLWDQNKNVATKGMLYAEGGLSVTNGTLALPGGWEFRTGDGHLRIFKGGDQKFVIHENGIAWANSGGVLIGEGHKIALKSENNKYITSFNNERNEPSGAYEKFNIQKL